MSEVSFKFILVRMDRLVVYVPGAASPRGETPRPKLCLCSRAACLVKHPLAMAAGTGPSGSFSFLMGKFLYRTTLGSLSTKFPISSFLEALFGSSRLQWFLNFILESKGFAGFFSFFGTLELFIWVSLDEVELEEAGILDIDCLVNVLLLLVFFTPTEDFRLEAAKLKKKKKGWKTAFSTSYIQQSNTPTSSQLWNV